MLFGELRLVEVTHIYEQMGFTLTTSLFGLATFRVENALVSGSLTIFNITLKVFHWILFDRIDGLFQVSDEDQLYSLKRVLFNRIHIAMGALLFVDYHFISYCIGSSYEKPSDIYVAYEFEVGLLFLGIIFNIFKILIHVFEIIYLKQYPDEESFEKKGLLIQVVDLMHVFIKALMYILLLSIFLNPYNFPIHVIRDCFISCMAFYKKLKDFIHFMKNAKRIDNYLPNAHQEDLEGSNSLCIICREDMTTEDLTQGHRLYPKKLRCNHIIHLGCLKSWLEISQLCPMCRAQVFENLDFAENSNANNGNNNNNNINDENNDNNNNNNAAGINRDVINPTPTIEIINNRPQPEDFFENQLTARNFQNGILQLDADALIPDDWTLLPLETTADTGTFKVCLGGDNWATLEIQDNKYTPDISEKSQDKEQIDVLSIPEGTSASMMKSFSPSMRDGSTLSTGESSTELLRKCLAKLQQLDKKISGSEKSAVIDEEEEEEELGQILRGIELDLKMLVGRQY